MGSAVKGDGPRVLANRTPGGTFFKNFHFTLAQKAECFLGARFERSDFFFSLFLVPRGRVWANLERARGRCCGAE